jgi:hypothetical protein
MAAKIQVQVVVSSSILLIYVVIRDITGRRLTIASLCPAES